MRTVVFVILCVHMLLWIGCYSVTVLPKLSRDGNNPCKGVNPTQTAKLISRKLLEDSADSDLNEGETTNAGSAAVSVDQNHGDEKGETEEEPEVKRTEEETSAVEKEVEQVETVPVNNENVEKTEEPKVETTQEIPKGEEAHEREAGDSQEKRDTVPEIVKEQGRNIDAFEEKPTPSSDGDEDGKAEGTTSSNEEEPSAQNLQELDSSSTSADSGGAASIEQVTEKSTNSESNEGETDLETQNKDAQSSAIDTAKEQEISDASSKTQKHDDQPDRTIDETSDKRETTEQERQDLPKAENRDLENGSNIKEVIQADWQGDDAHAKASEEIGNGSNNGTDASSNVSNDTKMDDTPVEKASEGTGGETNENSTTEEKKWEPEKEKEQESNDDSGKQQEGGKGREKRKNKQKEKKSQTSEGSTEIHDESKDAYAKEKSDEVQDSMGDSDHESSRDEAKDGDGDKKADDQELDSTSTENKHNGGENAHGEGEGGDAMEEKEERDLSGNSDHEWSGDKPKEGDKDKKIDDQETDISNTENRHDGGEETDTKDASLVTVGDEETQAATKEVEMQLEALKRDSVIDTSVDQAHERDPSEDEYDIIQELTDLPTKFQQTAGKVAEHLRPDVIKWKDTSKVYFDLANQQIEESFSPLIGRQYAPFFASLISYGILLLPLILVFHLFNQIKALFSLQKVLLFINIYLAAYFATLWLASFIIGLEPMSFFYSNSLSSYLSLQLLQAFGYLIYLILQTANFIYSCIVDTLVGKLTGCLQWVVAVGIGLHYYVTVFHPAVTSRPPHTSWKFYAMYTVAFFILCLFARIRWVKKQYVIIGANVTDKKS